MQAFKRGESLAFRELFDRYKNSIYGFVRRRVDDPGRAEEITQDIFLALIQRRNGYEVRARFRTYLYRIALNRRPHRTGACANQRVRDVHSVLLSI
jgi:RNA polymerase sigma-70 factor (ECF subfamily)